MHTRRTSLFWATLSLSTMAAPQTERPQTSIRIPLKHFSNRDLGTDLEATKQGAVALQNATKPSDLHSNRTLDKRADSGRVTLSRTETEYYGAIIIGNQEFQLAVDTGDTASWVFGGECTGSPCEGHAKYNPSGPGIGVVGDFDFSYEDGSAVTGHCYIDTFQIGGLTVESVPFGAAHTANDYLHKKYFVPDGILGLGILQIISQSSQTQSTQQPRSLLQALQIQYNINQFSFLFNERPELILGASHVQIAAEDMVYLPVLNPEKREWIVRLDGISADSQPDLLVSKSADALFDTGNTLINGPFDQIKAIYGAVKGTTTEIRSEKTPGLVQWMIQCDGIQTVNFIFGGKKFPVPLIAAHHKGMACYGTLTSHQTDKTGLWIIGQRALHVMYTIFQIRTPTGGPPTIGIGKLPHT